ncbi:MAG: sensor histidine kinase [Proteocatella sp.]
MKIRKKKKIANRLSFYVISSVIVTFIMVLLIAIFNMNNLIKTRIQNEVFVKTESATQAIWNIFENAIIITEQMSFNNEIKNYLKTTNTYEDIISNPLYPNVYKTLVDIQNSYRLNFLVWVANEKANFYLDSEGVIPDRTYDVKKRPWYKIAISSNNVVFTEPYIEWGTKSIVISAIKALRENDKVYGFVTVDMRLDSLPEIFDSVDIGEKGKLYLLDEKGNYIYAKDEQVNEMNIRDKDSFIAGYAETIMTGKRGFNEIDIKGERWYLSYRPATENGWIMVSLINEKETKNELILFTMQLAIIFIIAVAVLFGVIVYTIRSITLPIRIITDYGTEIAKGNLDIDLPMMYYKREDEMGELSRAFITITEVFRTQNEMLIYNLDEKNEEIKLQYDYILETEKLTSLGNLVAGVSHEVNTPLGVSLASATYLEEINSRLKNSLENGTLTKIGLIKFIEDIDESIYLLLKNLERASELIKNFKKIAVDQTNEMKSEFNLYELVNSIIISLKHEYKHTNVMIENYCNKDIILNSYAGPLTQVFTNMIINSLRHGFSEKKEGSIIIEAKIEDDYVVVIYKDNGQGIKKEFMNKIFEPFFTTNREGGNSGLGMFISKNIVEQTLEGTLLCESVYGEGVKFTIKIPRKI